ncbi:MAG: hypothetical protein QM741_12805 [Rudaea sp.]|uniref:hypothetical protein n=1 Tax=Rudaea sp. TaxID=2136325 RepID=UPI0039E70457
MRKMLGASSARWVVSAALFAGSGVTNAIDYPPDGLVVDLRYRNAHIDQAGYAEPANAHTLRFTLGYLWKISPQWSAYAEGTRVSTLFGEQYNSGANGKTKLPSEGDPPSSEISSAWLAYDNGTASARLGRQYVSLDNDRFFTPGLWRQNPQSFDAVAGALKFDTGTTIKYYYLDEAQRSVGHDYPDPTQREWDLDANLIHVDQKLPLGTLTGYGYFVENDTNAKYSWRTAGLRWTGKYAFGDSGTSLGWTAEGAHQESWRNNPLDYRAHYHLLELSYGFNWASLKLGDELLSGDGKNAFSSPYGSNHGFDGWTSQFKNTPANGLEDRYVALLGKLDSRLTWSVTFHNAFAERVDQHYGSEVNVLLNYALRRDLSVELDYADYHRRTFGTDERALWATLEYRIGKQGGI